MEDIVFRRYSKIAHLLTFTLSLTSSKLIKKILSFLVDQERRFPSEKRKEEKIGEGVDLLERGRLQIGNKR